MGSEILDEIKAIEKKYNLSPVKLLDISKEINLGVYNKEFKDIPNSIYLPLIGRSEAICLVKDLKLKSQNYIQIVLNPEKAYPGFVAYFFNTSLGLKIRDSLLSGKFIPRITKSTLIKAEIYLPELKIQKEIVKVNKDIKELYSQLKPFETELKTSPEKVFEIGAKVEEIKEKVRLVNEDIVANLIARGEGPDVEFKATLKKNLRTENPDSKMELEVLKTIVGFLNSEGGILLIGVTDEKEIIGIEKDCFPNEDKFMLHFENLLKNCIDISFRRFINYNLVSSKGKRVMIVNCDSSDSLVFLKFDGKEQAYARLGPSTELLEGKRVLEYAKRRFGNKNS